MTDQKNHVQQVPFERAMTRCAIEAGNEPSFIRNGDGAYVQREMQAAFTGWCEAMSSIEALLIEIGRSHDVALHAVSGELVSVSSSAVMGGSLKVAANQHTIRIEGLPESMVRACSSLLFERVELLVRAESVWMPAAQAARESGVHISLVRGWAQAGEVDQRDHDGVLQVGSASLRARALRYWQDRSQQTAAIEAGSAS